MSIEITYLKHHPQHVSILASWAFNMWGHYNPESTLERFVAKIEQHLNEDCLPLTYIALCNNKPVGMSSLRNADGIRPDLSPWLGSLFVHPDYRHQGIGEKLIATVITKAKEMHYSKLYLLAFDEILPLWYQRLGWKFIGIDEVYTHPVSVMEIGV